MTNFKWLKGKKTYLMGVALAVYSLLKVFNVLYTSPEQDTAVYGFLGALMGISIRSSIK